MYNNVTPHIATYIHDYDCDDLKLDNIKSILKEKRGVSEENIAKYNFLFTENMSGSIALKDHIATERVALNTKISERKQKDESYNENEFIYKFAENTKDLNPYKKFIQEVTIQVAYTLAVFNDIYFVHNDLHPGNIMVERLDEPFDHIYIIPVEGSNKIIRLRSNFFVRIFDFDRSYLIGNPTYDDYESDSIDLKSMDLSERIRDLGIKNEMTSDFQKYNGAVISKYIEEYRILKNAPPNDIESVFGNLSNKMGITQKISALSFLRKYIPDKQNQNITIYEELSNVDIEQNTKIFFPITINRKVIQGNMADNQSWKNLSHFDKMRVCSSIVTTNTDRCAIFDTLNPLAKRMDPSVTISGTGGGFGKSISIYQTNKVKYECLRNM